MIKNRTFNHLGLILELFPSNIISLLKIIHPISELYIGNGELTTENWTPEFHIKAKVDKKVLIILKDLSKKKIIEYYVNKGEVIIKLRIPSEFHSIVYHFIRGEYSKMLSRDLQKKLVNKNRVAKFNAYNKLGDYKNVFVNYIKASYNMHDGETHFINTENLEECDIPPLLKEEVLNFNIELKQQIINWHDQFKLINQINQNNQKSLN